MDRSRYVGTFSIQWHITNDCNNRCKHCYMFQDGSYEEEKKNELKFEQLIKILDDIKNFEEKWGFNINNFFITGGDPLLRKDWKLFIQELKNRGKTIHMMGNPETLTEENLNFLSEVGIKQFQMSLDGLEKTHDDFRSKGSFKRTVAALSKLKSRGIKASIMSTLTPINREEFFELMEYVVKETDADGFAFDLVASVGNAALITERFTPEDIKDIFTQYLEVKNRLYREGYSTQISEKSSLFKLLHYDNDDFNPYNLEENMAISGCHIGYTCFTIISDGSVMACRRLPMKVGKLPEQNIEEIFLGNEILKKFRRPQYYEECGKCKFFKVCRGCPSVVYGEKNDPFAKHPLCFKSLIKKNDTYSEIKEVPMDTTYEEECKLIKSHYNNIYRNNYDSYICRDKVLRLIGMLLNNKEERRTFLKEPEKYVQDKNINMQKDEIMFTVYYLDGIKQGKIANPIKYYFKNNLL